jgi:hypothetical protein
MLSAFIKSLSRDVLKTARLASRFNFTLASLPFTGYCKTIRLPLGFRSAKATLRGS